MTTPRREYGEALTGVSNPRRTLHDGHRIEAVSNATQAVSNEPIAFHASR